MEKDYELIAGKIFERGKYINAEQVVDRLNELSTLCCRLTDTILNPTPTPCQQKDGGAENILDNENSIDNFEKTFSATQQEMVDNLDGAITCLKSLKETLTRKLKDF